MKKLENNGDAWQENKFPFSRMRARVRRRDTGEITAGMKVQDL